MIRNLIFDVGNVLLGFRTMEMLQKHGMSPDRIEQMVRGVFSDPLWARLDLGIDPFSDVVELFCRNLPELRSDIHWLIQNSEQMKVDRPDVWERVHLLGKKGYKLYILSNYAEPFYNKQFRDAPFMAWMQVCFEALPFVARLALKVMTSPTWQSGMVMYWFCPLKQIRSL